MFGISYIRDPVYREKDQEDYSRAVSFAYQAHFGQQRRDGSPYSNHPLRVADSLNDDYGPFLGQIGALHDVIEDCAEIFKSRLETEFPEILEYLEILTHSKDESYNEYIDRVSKNEITRLVKIYDILDNLSDSPTEKQVKKYAKALKKLIR